MALGEAVFTRPAVVIGLSLALRLVLLIYGHFQDQWSALKYTDIDYYVFTDAAHAVAQGQSPYTRDTYRYTPLLAWILVPTTWGGAWFDSGKALFALSDVFAGFLIYTMLKSFYAMPTSTATKYASIWLLNPMVAQISTRGSSEGLLAVVVMALLWAILNQRIALAAVILGFAVHLKIYPFIYGLSVICVLDNTQDSLRVGRIAFQLRSVTVTYDQIKFCIYSLLTFSSLNLVMTLIYSWPFLEHTFFYHLVRTDHRHNFSPYNILLYLNSSPAAASSLHTETLAFLPQLLLSGILIPLALARVDLANTMFAQTFAFVTFNKVCTSQYFLWYMVFLPFYLPRSTMVKDWRIGTTALVLWVAGQVFWLQQGYRLEFLGTSAFIPGLFSASLLFYCINIWILSILVVDTIKGPHLEIQKERPYKKSR